MTETVDRGLWRLLWLPPSMPYILGVTRLASCAWVAEGLTNRQIAERLFLSRHTVGSHLRHAFTHLDITSRVNLARLVVQHDQAAS